MIQPVAAQRKEKPAMAPIAAVISGHRRREGRTEGVVGPVLVAEEVGREDLRASAGAPAEVVRTKLALLNEVIMAMVTARFSGVCSASEPPQSPQRLA